MTRIQYKNKQSPAGKTAGLVGVFTTYNYLADGTKVRTVAAGDSVDYDDGIQYNNSVMNFIANPEGRADVVTGLSKYSYSYNLTDHLGNVRVTEQRNTANWELRKVAQEDEYYSFGLRVNKYSLSTVNNRYLYNGKEIQNQLTNQYDYGARFYDPVIARWTTTDPLAEVNRRWSTYGYVKNNPINRIDPDGMIDYVPGASEAADAAYEAKVAKTQAEADHFVDSHLGAIFGVSSGSNSTSSSSTRPVNLDSAGPDDPKNKIGANQGGPRNEVLIGFYNSKYIASDFPFGEKLGIDGAFVGNVKGLGFLVQYTTNSGLKREFPVLFNTANFTIPSYGLIKNKFAASELFVTAYNLAVQETARTIELLSPETINPFTVRADFLMNLNLNLNVAHPGSLFSGGGNASGNFPATPAQWLTR